MLFDDDFVASRRGPIKSAEQNVQIDRQAVHDGNLGLLGAHESRHGLLGEVVGMRGGQEAIEVTVDSWRFGFPRTAI